MCGIISAVTLRGHKPACGDHESLSKAVDESLDTIKHRGPDSKGQWISEDGRVGMSDSYRPREHEMHLLQHVQT
jgi:asparagine synthase (glutamine-hydrolysing)